MPVLPSANLALPPLLSRCLSSCTTPKYWGSTTRTSHTIAANKPERKMGSRTTFVQLYVRRAKTASAPTFVGS